MPLDLYSQSFKNVPTNPITKELLQKYQVLIKKIKAKELAMIDIIFNENDLQAFEKLAQKISKYKIIFTTS